MDHSLLLAWLGLAPGPWPPNHYALLGLAPGKCDPDQVEPLVLTYMARLRAHQLLHPDLVTEGMNRLARALICLTDPVARSNYDRELGIASVEIGTGHSVTPPGLALATSLPRAKKPEMDEVTVLLEEEQTEPSDTLEATVVEMPFQPGLQPPSSASVGYEVVEEYRREPDPLPYEVIWDAVLQPPSEEPEEVNWEGQTEPPGWTDEAIDAEVAEPASNLWQPTTRRQLFARLSLVRRLQRTWQKLEPVLADPLESLDSPISVLKFLEAASEARTLQESLLELLGGMGRPGGLAATIIMQPLPLATIRDLLAGQRRVLSQDWHQGERTLSREYGRLRELVRSGRPGRSRARLRYRIARRIVSAFVQTPEVILIVLGALVLLRLAIRSRWGL